MLRYTFAAIHTHVASSWCHLTSVIKWVCLKRQDSQSLSFSCMYDSRISLITIVQCTYSFNCIHLNSSRGTTINVNGKGSSSYHTHAMYTLVMGKPCYLIHIVDTDTHSSAL